ncbi:MAG TPA: hypothetical protein VK190_04925 [Pseudoneobacillus sp.]|nr:hypothetical protein [Pseudoneobacillus sp.]
MATDLETISEEKFKKLKKKYEGFYYKFNQNVTKWYIWKMFDYETLNDGIENFKSFKEFLKFHTKNRYEVVDYHINQMMSEANRKGLKSDYETVRDCLHLRLGNIYYGAFAEHKILTVFNNLKPWITCEKTSKEIDTNYKVDGIVTLVGIDQIAIQIKPISFSKYGLGSEEMAHKQFEKEFGMRVYYVFYEEHGVIAFHGTEIKLTDIEKIVEKIYNLVNSY